MEKEVVIFFVRYRVGIRTLVEGYFNLVPSVGDNVLLRDPSTGETNFYEVKDKVYNLLHNSVTIDVEKL